MSVIPSTDGVVLAVHDLGGSGPPLLLAHATGFHGRVLSPLAGHLTGDFHCFALDFRGHGDSPAPADVDYDWSGLADDVVETLDSLQLDEAFGFGHSSGGAAVLMAEARHPGRFRSLFCYEPILWPDPHAALPRAQALTEGARRRRPGFATKEDAYANYEAKPPFAWLDPAVLSAYVDHGFADSGDGTVTLKCSPQVEALIYLKGAENDRFSELARVGCPVVVARGTERGAVEREVVEAQVRALPAARLEEMTGLSHFGPLEDPGRVAAAIRRAFLD